MKNDETLRYSTPWITALTTYEGAPIALRIRPEANSAANRKRYCRRVAIIHQLAEVAQNGLPAAEYNKGLAVFDDEVHQCLESDGDGLVVLVETFSGRGIYFSYVRPVADTDVRIELLKAKYPQHSLRAKSGG